MKRTVAVIMAGALLFAPVGAGARSRTFAPARSPAPEVAPSLGANTTVGKLAGGGTFIVRHTSGVPLTAVSLWYRAPSIGYGPQPVRSLSQFAAQSVAASQPITGTPLGKLVADLGGRLSIEAYATSVSVSAVVPASVTAKVVHAMTAAYFAPVVTSEGVRQAAQDLASDALQARYKPDVVLRDALFAQLFPEGPAHFEGLAEPGELAKISLDNVTDFAKRAFRAQNAFLVVAGPVADSVAGAAVAGRPAAGEAAMDPPLGLGASSDEPLRSKRDFGEPGAGLAWIGPPITDERAATAMDFVADYLFRADDGVVARRASAEFPDAFIAGQFITLHDPGVMLIETAGKGAAGVRDLVDDQLGILAKPLPPGVFNAAREAFLYHLLSDLQTPLEIADNFGWYAVEGNPGYAPGVDGSDGTYFKVAAALTPEFVAATVREYLGKNGAVVDLAKPSAKDSAR